MYLFIYMQETKCTRDSTVKIEFGWYAILATRNTTPLDKICLKGFDVVMSASILLPRDDLRGVQSIPDLLQALMVPDPLWNAFIAQVGDPGNNLRIVAALPAHIISSAALQALLPTGDAISPVQAAHLGLVWRNSRKLVHFWAGLPEEDFVDIDPWQLESKKDAVNLNAGQGHGSGSTSLSTTPAFKERVLKMNMLVDQTDESELGPPSKNQLDLWLNSYTAVMGASPQEEEEPTEGQLAALHKRVYVLQQPPYTDFAIWQPFGRKLQKTQKFRTHIPLGDGTFLLRELPGPQNLQQWLLSWRLFKVAAICLDIASLASLQLYEKTIERLVVQWPKCWGLIASAEDKARAERLEKHRRKLAQDEANGGTLPPDWNSAKPWTCCFRMLAVDEEYWSEQVRHPAASWTAAGGRGALMAPAEQAALAHMPGGAESFESHVEEGDGKRKQSNRDKRLAKQKRLKSDREELQRLRGHGSGHGQGEGNPQGKAKGKGKSKDQAGMQICYSFANGTGPCGQVAPGSECLQKVKRAHKCQFCYSPGHRNADCPKKA